MGNCIIELFWEMVGRGGGDSDGIASYPGMVAQLQRGRTNASSSSTCSLVSHLTRGQTTRPGNVTDLK